jgi:hypothetical protein
MCPVNYFQVISCVNVNLVSDISETVSLIVLMADDRDSLKHWILTLY